MDRLDAMQTFVRVVETGSFSAVARELGATQSAVSKQIAGLERHLGARLLTRTTRSLALTEDGERYFETARRLVGEIVEAESLLKRGEQQLSGWLRVAAPGLYGRAVVMPIVRDFLRQHPGVKIDLKLADRTVDLAEEGIDISVRIGTLPDSSLVARQVGRAPRTLLAARSYVEEHGVPRIPDELQAHNCIVFTELAVRDRWEFLTGDGSRVSVRVNGTLQTNSSEISREAVLQGVGIGYMLRQPFAEELARGEVVALLTDWSVPAPPVHLLMTQQRKSAIKVRAFADHVAARLAHAEGSR
jgi:DNA-binding transcriptional LysR family regulator